MFNVTSNFDSEAVMKHVMAQAEEAFAERLADEALERGVTDPQNLEVELAEDSDQINVDNVLARAREILAEKLA